VRKLAAAAGIEAEAVSSLAELVGLPSRRRSQAHAGQGADARSCHQRLADEHRHIGRDELPPVEAIWSPTRSADRATGGREPLNTSEGSLELYI